jgi:hypothetical protein
MLEAILAAAAAVAVGYYVVRRRQLEPRVPSPVLPAHELQRRYGLYAENRPAIRLDPARVPAHLHDLIPLAETWGIGDDLIRFDFQQKAPEAAKRELMTALEGRAAQVQQWLDSQPDTQALSDEVATFMYLLLAWDEVRPVDPA